MLYVLPFVLAMVVTMAWVPVLVRLAHKWQFLDQPGARKVHDAPIPRVGGIAMASGVFVAAAVTIHLQPADRWFLVAGGVLVIFGAIDDRFDLNYRIKLAGQILAVGIVVLLGGLRIIDITFVDRLSLPLWVSIPLTVFFLVGVTNAINLADGLDGLAGGTTFLCLCAVALFANIGDQGVSTAFALAFAGAVLGFLRFNTYPASVFMGDAGSQLLGFAVGVLSIRATQSTGSEISAAIPVLLLALPILDTLNVMVQRISEGRSPFSADKNHIHHKLLALGFDHHEAVMVIYTLQGVLFVAAYFLRFESDLVILGVVSAFFIGSILALQIASRTGWRFHAHALAVTNSRLTRFITVLYRPNVLPRLSYWALVIALGTYALLVVFDSATLTSDIRILVIALLAVIVASLIAMRVAPLSIAEKAILYVTAAILVYLDVVLLPPDRVTTVLSWVAIGIAGIATAIRLRFYDDRRFQVSPLDLIVLFMALVVPSLPGMLRLPEGTALGIAKLFVLFYSIEMLVSRPEGRAVWMRIAAACVLAGLALRSLVPLP